MRRTALIVAGIALLASVALAVSAGESAQLAASQTLNLVTVTSSAERVYPGSLTGHLGEVRSYRADLTGTDPGYYRATCIWLGSKGDNRLDCTVLLRLKKGIVIVQGLVDPPGDPRLLSQPATSGQLAITGGTGPYNGARGYVQLRPQSFTVQID